ncbi:hypothetical protein DV453_001883 [Geotrichum candidum]|nr:hypothetical protein DV453_001883 [Geotrichum candidum]
MENACVREIRQVNPDIVILRDAAWVQVLRSLGYRTYGHIHYRADKFAVFTIKDQSTDAEVVTNDSKGGSTTCTSNGNGCGSVTGARESLMQQHESQAAVVLQNLKTWDRIIVSSSGSEQAGVVDIAARFQPVQGKSRDNKLCMPVIIAGSEPTRLQSPLLQNQPQQHQAQSCLGLKETSGFWYSDTTLALEEYMETPQHNEFAARFRLRSGISRSQNKRLLDSSRNNGSDSLNNEAKLTSQYGSMLITQALLKSRQHQQQKSRRNITYSNAGYGVFAQSDPDTDDTQFNYLTARDFGLVLEGSWRELQQRLHSLNRNPPTPNTRYKLLFLARHGQGYHNLAIEIYGQKAWDDYWSLLDTDGNIVWGPDPELTPLGTEQAKRNNIAWRKQIDDRDILVPKTHYVSPFTRALDTYKETWNRLRNDKTDGGPLVVEDLRETIGVHTCDRRRTRSYIRERYPGYPIEDGFAEKDELWTADYRETPEEQNVRIRRFLDQYVFGDEGDDAVVVGVTAHSGTIKSVLEVIGHRKFNVGTGGIIPVLVKAVVEDL